MTTLALAVICKNERNNLPRLLDSVKDCFDEIHVTDTGSTDGTIEWIETQPHIKLHQFKWIDDFSAARNYAFSHPTTDYVMWLDCDDVLDNREAFIQWKKELLATANYWCATYHYGLDGEGKPVCSFMRERAIKNRIGLSWQHFVHEGIPPASGIEPIKVSYASSWAVKHVRSAEDMKADKNRNLSMFEKNREKMNDRLEYYYGKELFEAGKFLEAYSQLTKAMSLNQEPHDKILCIQYAAMAAQQCNQWDKVIELAQQGLRLAPHRAEFYLMVGDSYLKTNQFDNAIPSFVAACHCINQAPNDAVFQTPIFTNAGAYEHYPRNQLARIFFHRGKIDEAKAWLEDAMKLGPHAETATLYAEIVKLKDLTSVKPLGSVPVVDEYVITCPQQAMYLWDEDVAKTRGIGGSETAVVRMARLLRNKTGKKVRVFVDRPNTTEFDGVIYAPHTAAREYFYAQAPKAHIAWRHNVRLTSSPTYLWCHDLVAPDIGLTANYDKVLALSEFHKNYLKHIFRVPEEKILVTRNGIDLCRFHGKDFSTKNENKIVFSSSPDRGLERAIRVVEALRQKTGKSAELHAFYGFDNMIKLNLHQQVAQFQKLINDRPWVKFHGNVQQDALVEHLKDAKVWLYPTDFLETFCITALEMLACQVRPVVRQHGALPFTLAGTPATILDRDCQTQDDVDAWVCALEQAMGVEQPAIDMSRYSWDSVADEWLTWLPL